MIDVTRLRESCVGHAMHQLQDALPTPTAQESQHALWKPNRLRETKPPAAQPAAREAMNVAKRKLNIFTQALLQFESATERDMKKGDITCKTATDLSNVMLHTWLALKIQHVTAGRGVAQMVAEAARMLPMRVQ